MQRPDERELEEIRLKKTLVRINATALGLVLGLVMGLAVFLATNILVIEGGHVTSEGERIIGPHLQLLGQFFIGYSVSFVGSLVGFVYGFAVGTITGAAIGRIYNFFAFFHKQ